MAIQNFKMITDLNGVASLKDPIGYLMDNTNTITGVTEINMLSFDSITFKADGTHHNGANRPDNITNLYGGIFGITIYGFGLDALPLKITKNINKNNNYKFEY